MLTSSGVGAKVSSNVVTISAAGTYILSGALADNTENNINDGTSYTLKNFESEDPNSTIFSKSDFTIKGAYP